MKDEHKYVILFDGVCNLCTSSVQFVIPRDHNNKFKYASLQSNYGQEVIKKYSLHNIDSIIYKREGKIKVKSTAALWIARDLGLPLSFLFIFIVVPSFIRNFVYDIIAKNRYKWFGEKDSCWMPTPDLLNKFIS